MIYYLLGGEPAKAELDSMKSWLALHNAAVMTVLFLVLGVVIFVVMEMELSTGLRVLLVLGWSLLVSTFAALRWGSVSAAVCTVTSSADFTTNSRSAITGPSNRWM